MKNILAIGLMVLSSLSAVPQSAAAQAACIGTVGDVKMSLLNPVQFQRKNGGCWARMEGGSIVGTELAQLVPALNDRMPDATGMFLRGMSSDRVIGSYQEDSMKEHRHNIAIVRTTSHAHMDGGNNHYPLDAQHKENAGHKSTNPSGNAAETRPKNISVYIYVNLGK